jgi:hypothetical protein
LEGIILVHHVAQKDVIQMLVVGSAVVVQISFQMNVIVILHQALEVVVGEVQELLGQQGRRVVQLVQKVILELLVLQVKQVLQEREQLELQELQELLVQREQLEAQEQLVQQV